MLARGRRSAAALAVLAVVLGLLPPAVAAQTELPTLIVQLESAAAGPAEARAKEAGEPFDLATYGSQLIAEQDRFLRDLQALGVTASLVTLNGGENGADAGESIPARWTFAVNGVAIKASASAVPIIQSMPGVRYVEFDREVRVLLAESVPYVRAPPVWQQLDARGEGQTIADIDTGIDWTHPSFTKDPTLLPGVNHPKVQFYLTLTAGATDDHGHGSHVGSTIAGDSGLGYTTGTRSEIDDLGRSLFDGVAPKAHLWGYKVCHAAGSCLTVSIVTAINDAAQRRAKAMNLSLGADFDDPNSVLSKAVDGAMRSGTVVAVAAGNSGPGYSTIGTPATARLGLTVGAATDLGDDQYFIVHKAASEQRRMAINLFSNSPVPPKIPPIESLYVYVDLGCTPLDYAGRASVAGRIALIKRGTCTFTQKALLAQELGAVAGLIFNNVPGDFSGTMAQTRIPVGALSDTNGAYLIQTTFIGADGLSKHTVFFDPDSVVIAGRVTGFSSRGPTDDYRIKPDVVAPGNAVTAATTKVGPPLVSMASPSGYTTAGGTSMATPHVAGAAALLRQVRANWTTFEVKAALMNTARQLADPADGKLYSIMDQGAGLIDAYAAATTKGLLQGCAVTPKGKLDCVQASHSFGHVENNGGVVTRKAIFRIRDVSGNARTYQLIFEPGDGKDRGGQGRALPAAGFDVSLKTTSVSVPANGAAAFTLTVTVDGSQLAAGDYEGRIVATAPDQTLRAPVFYRAVHLAAADRNPPRLADPGDRSSTGDYTLTWSKVRKAVGYRLQEATQVTTVFADDAESGLTNWTVGGTAGPVAWSSSDLRTHSGGRSFFAFQGPDQSNTLTLSKPITLPAGTPTLSFWTYYDTEPQFDFGYLEAGRDGTNWTVLGSVDGFSDGWVKKDFDLSAFAGGPVLLRFRYRSDLIFDAGLFEGWYVDDISVSSANWTTIAEPTNTSFAVADRTDGTYYYRVAGLFDTKQARRAQGPWSNVVDIVVKRP